MPDHPESESLIESCGSCGALIDVSEQEPYSDIFCPSCGARNKARIQFRNFKLLGVLGRGGMGTVFRAHDLNLNRDVALKVLRTEYSANPDDVGRIEREARITASVNHPNVIKIYSFGSDHGQFFLAMELADKGSLDDLMGLQGTVSEVQVLEIGLQIASGLEAASRAGLIHRDVKPGNILFTDSHMTKIVDFGLALLMDEEAAQRGEIWGTPYYIAPEKLDNRPEDFRSDMYSLGGTLFHAIAGRPPYEANTASMVALKHLKSQPVSLQAFAPNVSSETSYVINKMLHKDPEQRYQTYADLVDHLRYAHEKALAKVGKPSAGRQKVVVESEEQITLLGWVSLGVILLLLGGLAYLFFNWGRITNPDAVIVAPAEVDNRRAATEDDLAEEARAEYESARALLARGEFEQSYQIFSSLTENPNARTFSAWNEAHLLLTCYLSGRPDEGKQLLEEFRPGKEADDDALKPFANAITQLAETGELQVPANGPAMLAYLIAGTKAWQNGEFDLAAQFFKEYAEATPPGAVPWMGDYRQVTRTYLADFEALQAARKLVEAASSGDINERRKALIEVRKLQGRLLSGSEIMSPFEDFVRILSTD